MQHGMVLYYVEAIFLSYIFFAEAFIPSTHVRTPFQRISLHLSVNDENESKIVNVAIVGGGWAGYSAAESLSSNPNVNITLLDASKAKGGLAGGFRTEQGRPVEAGIHGFWREYRNTFKIMQDIQGVEIDEVLSDYTPSVLFSKNGKVAVAPVLGKEENEGFEENKKPFDQSFVLSEIAKKLPPPLDIALLAEFSPSSPLSPLDRVSAIGLLGAWADFEQESKESWSRYDKFSAEELFKKAGITDVLYEELVAPLLHVLPMCPAYDCSAAAALSCFHVFALQSPGAFDVRWCKGSIAEKIFAPWGDQLERRGVNVLGGAKATSIEKSEDKDGSFIIKLNEEEELSCDAIVLAVGGTSMSRISSSSSAISSLDQAKNFDKLRGVTCVAVRLFLQPHPTVTDGLNGGEYDKTELSPELANAMKDSPVIVCGPGIGGLESLKETGFCIYDLQRMHEEFAVENVLQYNNRTAVLEIDFYRADSIADMNNDEVVNLALKTIAATFRVSPLKGSSVIDSAVLRARSAVSHFAPNSASYSPDVKIGSGIYACGDWIDRNGHASWSTEKSVVTGRQAALALSTDFSLENSACDVIGTSPDTTALTALRKSTKILRSFIPPPNNTAPPSPWVLGRELFEDARKKKLF